ncbi:hypothetical protein LTR37_010088 [Vermiconidia calcicola]|uniref:Uncharacterized protein n=1 Tax=Vermiconidia calcicola TaxID=1690605 RepID=A0ACC3N7U5_9PEZI|nr:hypothetical protein LTR37_010088 [Vermiconidia calcicola]
MTRGANASRVRASRARITKLEKRMGFKWPKGFSRSKKQSRQVVALRNLIDDIGMLNRTFRGPPSSELRRDTDFKERCEELYVIYAPKLWPTLPPADRSGWLVDAQVNNLEDLYPEDLYFDSDEELNQETAEKRGAELKRSLRDRLDSTTSGSDSDSDYGDPDHLDCVGCDDCNEDDEEILPPNLKNEQLHNRHQMPAPINPMLPVTSAIQPPTGSIGTGSSRQFDQAITTRSGGRVLRDRSSHPWISVSYELSERTSQSLPGSAVPSSSGIAGQKRPASPAVHSVSSPAKAQKQREQDGVQGPKSLVVVLKLEPAKLALLTGSLSYPGASASNIYSAVGFAAHSSTADAGQRTEDTSEVVQGASTLLPHEHNGAKVDKGKGRMIDHILDTNDYNDGLASSSTVTQQADGTQASQVFNLVQQITKEYGADHQIEVIDLTKDGEDAKPWLNGLLERPDIQSPAHDRSLSLGHGLPMQPMNYASSSQDDMPMAIRTISGIAAAKSGRCRSGFPLDDGRTHTVAAPPHGGHRYVSPPPTERQDATVSSPQEYASRQGTSSKCATEQEASSHGGIREETTRILNIELTTDEANRRQFIRVDSHTSVENLFSKVQARVHRRLTGQQAQVLELRLPQHPTDTNAFDIERDDADTWRVFLDHAAEVVGDKVYAVAHVQV